MHNIFAGELLAPKEGLNITIWDEKHQIPWKENRYLVLELEGMEEHSLTLCVEFYTRKDTDRSDFRISFSILPKMVVTVPIDLKVLDSQELFIKRTKGRLRMMVSGKPLRIEDICGIKLTTLRCYKEQRINLKAMYLSETMPECKLPEIALMDAIGQWIPKDWEGKLPDVFACTGMLKGKHLAAEKAPDAYGNEEWDSYGGWKRKQFDRTGWFHVANDGNRFWLVDPEGNAFFSTGIDCINPGNDTRIDLEEELCQWIPSRDDEMYTECRSKNGTSFNYGIANLIRAFGKEQWKEGFVTIVKHYLYQWHVNTIGNWSSMDFIRAARMPYVLPLDSYSEAGFPSTSLKIFRDFPDVFATEYEENSREFAKAILLFRDDPYLIGYFMRNEPTWGFQHNLNIAEEMLACDAALASKREFIRRMAVKYQDIAAFNEAWNCNLASFDQLMQPIRRAADCSEAARADLTDFSREMITRYVALPAQEIRKNDPNHLNLGMRYAYIPDPVMLSGHEYFDVFSINSYQMNPYNQIQSLGEIIRMPIMIGEFHFGALDKGLVSTGLRGVPNQKQRGVAYRHYVEQGTKSPYFLGAHYFQFGDQNCLGRFDGENYQIGITDIALQEYQEMTDIMKDCHRHIYEVLNGDRAPSEEKAEEIPAIHC